MNREGMILVLFDLPVRTKQQQAEYRRFTKHLKKTGYMFFQKSVYVKPLHNLRICAEEKAKLRPALPKEGSVSVLRMTAGSFRAIEQLLGTEFDPELSCGSVITY